MIKSPAAVSNSAAASGLDRYPYDHVTARILFNDLDFSDDAARPGQKGPAFDLPAAAGGRVRTADSIGKRPILLFTGSLSCPMTVSSNILLKRLHARFGEAIAFIMIYVREAHPGENIPQPRTLGKKLEHARELQARDDLPWPVAVDDIEGTVHRALDIRPNIAYLLDQQGMILFRALCAGDEKGVTAALARVASGRAPDETESRRRFTPMAEGIGNLRRITREAGPRAEADIWRAVPPVAMIARLADLYRPLRAKWRAIASAATLISGLAASGAAARRFSRTTR